MRYSRPGMLRDILQEVEGLVAEITEQEARGLEVMLRQAIVGARITKFDVEPRGEDFYVDIETDALPVEFYRAGHRETYHVNRFRWLVKPEDMKLAE